MHLVKQHISKDGSGYVTLRPQEDEDIWHAYNLITQASKSIQPHQQLTGLIPQLL